ncbi:MAG: hypothetical protein JSV42_01225 [Chloroflexota bacterium]|nr:MAG: hypothetical protein JSV42_01225 [Chloroflexota bacterium]
MGLDYTYLPDFKRQHMWDALQGMSAFTQLLSPDTCFQFPEGDRYLPLQIWSSNVNEYSLDDPRFSFATSLSY